MTTLRTGLVFVVALAFGAATAQENIFRNLGTSGYVPTTLVFTNNEVGDDLNLGGVGRVVRVITIPYSADIAAPQNDERVKVRIRNLSGATPTTLIWESGPIDLKNGFHTVAVRVPSITVLNNIAVTVQFLGMAGGAGDRAALVKWNSPTIGVSAGTYPEFVGGVWVLQGAVNGNFGMSVWATAEPNAYDTLAAPVPTDYYYPSPNEYGEAVYLETPGQVVSQFQGYVYGDFAVPQGDESMTIRFYKLDAVTYKPTGAALYSQTVPLVAGTQLVSVAPNVSVPSDFIYTVGFNNLTYNAGDQAGLCTRDPATAGWSGDYFVERDNNPDWGFFYFSPGPVANFNVRITAVHKADTLITSVTIGPGSILTGTVADLATSNDTRLNTRPGSVLISTQPPLVVNFSATSPNLNPESFRFIFEGNGSIPTLTQRLFLYVPVSNTYEEVDVRNPASTTDQQIDTVITSNPSRYINQGTGEIRARVNYKANGAVLVYPWQGRFDYVVFRIYP